MESATPIAEMAGVDLRVEPRLRERMNGEGPEVQPLEAFLHDWQRATRDRAWRPPGGDSSAEDGARFLDVLAEVPASPSHTDVVVVSHGGVTVDALRDLLGDDEVQVRAPRLLDDGVPPCAITELVLGEDGWAAGTIGSVAHLASTSPPSPTTRPPRPPRS